MSGFTLLASSVSTGLKKFWYNHLAIPNHFPTIISLQDEKVMLITLRGSILGLLVLLMEVTRSGAVLSPMALDLEAWVRRLLAISSQE